MTELGWDVLRLEQPWRLAPTKRPAAPANQLDDVLRAVMKNWGGKAPLVLVGRSSGSRVACRTATELGAELVIALGFPLNAPNGKSRQDELDGAGVPVLVIQGTNDSFGIPAKNARKQREVIRIDGADHALERPRSQEDPLEEIVALIAERVKRLGR